MRLRVLILIGIGGVDGSGELRGDWDLENGLSEREGGVQLVTLLWTFFLKVPEASFKFGL